MASICGVAHCFERKARLRLAVRTAELVSGLEWGGHRGSVSNTAASCRQAYDVAFEPVLDLRRFVGGSGFLLLVPTWLVLNAIMAIDMVILSNKRKAANTKKCPFCAEVIQREARVCKHCGREVPKAIPT